MAIVDKPSLWWVDPFSTLVVGRVHTFRSGLEAMDMIESLDAVYECPQCLRLPSEGCTCENE